MGDLKYTIEPNPTDMIGIPEGDTEKMTTTFSYYPTRTKQINFTVEGEERFVQLYQGSKGFGLLFKRDSGVTRLTLSEEAATATFKLLLGSFNCEDPLEALLSRNKEAYIDYLEIKLAKLQEGLSGMIKQQTDILGTKRDLTVLSMSPIIMIKHIEGLLEED